MPRTFRTVSDDLLEHAEAVALDFELRGYRVRAEHRDPGFPYTPTLVSTRARTTVIADIVAEVDLGRVNTWVNYARSTGRDTRLSVCVSAQAQITQADETALQDRGVGLYISEPGRVIERLAPQDLALNVTLPELAALPPRVREWLGPVYEQFGRAQWREGFGDACQVLETEARRYLKRGIQRKRISLRTKTGNIRTLTAAQIDKLTMGQLAEAFSQIQSKTQADSVIGQVLARVNKDRVGVTHHKGKAVTETRLRRNVGQHMWCVVGGLKELA